MFDPKNPANYTFYVNGVQYSATIRQEWREEVPPASSGGLPEAPEGTAASADQILDQQQRRADKFLIRMQQETIDNRNTSLRVKQEFINALKKEREIAISSNNSMRDRIAELQVTVEKLKQQSEQQTFDLDHERNRTIVYKATAEKLQGAINLFSVYAEQR